MFFVLALTDDRNPGRPHPTMAPFFIGFTVACIIVLIAPLTQAGLNPARDFGPRIIALLAGWGQPPQLTPFQEGGRNGEAERTCVSESSWCQNIVLGA